MHAESIVTVSASVVALTQLIKWTGYVPERTGPLVVLALALVGVGFYAWTAGDFDRGTAFMYFAGWVSVALNAAGTYGFSRAANDTLTRGTGAGR